jgi:hypothetical protein
MFPETKVGPDPLPRPKLLARKSGFERPLHYKQILTAVYFTSLPFQALFLNTIPDEATLTIIFLTTLTVAYLITVMLAIKITNTNPSFFPQKPQNR